MSVVGQSHKQGANSDRVDNETTANDDVWTTREKALAAQVTEHLRTQVISAAEFVQSQFGDEILRESTPIGKRGRLLLDTHTRQVDDLTWSFNRFAVKGDIQGTAMIERLMKSVTVSFDRSLTHRRKMLAAYRRSTLVAGWCGLGWATMDDDLTAVENKGSCQRNIDETDI